MWAAKLQALSQDELLLLLSHLEEELERKSQLEAEQRIQDLLAKHNSQEEGLTAIKSLVQQVNLSPEELLECLAQAGVRHAPERFTSKIAFESKRKLYNFLHPPKGS